MFSSLKKLFYLFLIAVFCFQTLKTDSTPPGETLAPATFLNLSTPSTETDFAHSKNSEKIIWAFLETTLAVSTAGAISGIFILYARLFDFFLNEPFHYSPAGSFATALITGTTLLRVIKKALLLFEEDDENLVEELPRDKRKRRLWLWQTFFLVLPLVFYFDFGALCQHAAMGWHFFFDFKLHYVLIPFFAFYLTMRYFLIMVGYSNEEETVGQRFQTYLESIFIVSVVEEVLFRFVLFNFLAWFLTVALNFSEPLTLLLPIGANLELPLGVLMAATLNAESFFKKRHPTKWFSYWLLGAINSSLYYTTGSLIVPIVVHILWNGLNAVYEETAVRLFPFDQTRTKPLPPLQRKEIPSVTPLERSL